VWNYLIKPVATHELRANFSMLAELVRNGDGWSRSVRCLRVLLPEDVTAGLGAERVPALQAAVTQVERYCGEKLRQAAVAANCGMSTSSFSRAFKAEYGLTFSDYLMRFRIGRACRLLRQGSHSATTAGLAVGFEDASHFARAFRKLLGVSPSSYQRQKSPLKPLNERRRRARAVPGKAALRIARPGGPAEPAGYQFEQAPRTSSDTGG
jgi:AraC-like DNA-binding protein